MSWSQPCCNSHPQIDFVRCDVRQLAGQARLKADTVVMNPPFGTRRKGAAARAGLCRVLLLC